jgi:hypothetical protein
VVFVVAVGFVDCRKVGAMLRWIGAVEALFRNMEVGLGRMGRLEGTRGGAISKGEEEGWGSMCGEEEGGKGGKGGASFF